jgi:hypothetical protein
MACAVWRLGVTTHYNLTFSRRLVGCIDFRRKENLVELAPAPAFARLERFDDRMAS